MEVVNKMEIFITLTKYNTHSQCEEGTHCEWWLLSQQKYPHHNSVQCINEDWDIPIKVHIYYHHHVVPPARISLTLSRHISISFIASGRSSGLHPESSQSCCMYVQAGCPAFARPYVGVYRSTSLMSSSLLLRQCPACLVHLTWIVFMMGSTWLYSWCFVGCCLQDLFNIACSILV